MMEGLRLLLRYSEYIGDFVPGMLPIVYQVTGIIQGRGGGVIDDVLWLGGGGGDR